MAVILTFAAVCFPCTALEIFEAIYLKVAARIVSMRQ